jgi:hypothetical protein
VASARFPQLHDSRFLHQTRLLSDQDLAGRPPAGRIGCAPGAVRHTRHKFDVHLDKPWNAVEEEMMAVFYGPPSTAPTPPAS